MSIYFYYQRYFDLYQWQHREVKLREKQDHKTRLGNEQLEYKNFCKRSVPR